MCCSFDTEQSKMSVQATCALTIHVWVASTAGCQPAHPFRVNMSCRSREVPRCSCCRERSPAIHDVSSSGTLAWMDSSVTPVGAGAQGRAAAVIRYQAGPPAGDKLEPVVGRAKGRSNVNSVCVHAAVQATNRPGQAEQQVPSSVCASARLELSDSSPCSSTVMPRLRRGGHKSGVCVLCTGASGGPQ